MCIDKVIMPKINYFKSNFPDFDYIKMIMNYPDVLSLSLDMSIKNKVTFFTEHLKIDIEDLQNSIPEFPQIFKYSIEHDIIPRIEFLAENLHYNKSVFISGLNT